MQKAECRMKKAENMKTKLLQFRLAAIVLLSAFILHPSPLLRAATTIDAGNHYAYGANLGWMDWRGDTANGAVIGEYVCSGYIYAANVGWITWAAAAPPTASSTRTTPPRITA